MPGEQGGEYPVFDQKDIPERPDWAGRKPRFTNERLAEITEQSRPKQVRTNEAKKLTAVPDPDGKISRRGFLKYVAGAGAAAVLGGIALEYNREHPANKKDLEADTGQENTVDERKTATKGMEQQAIDEEARAAARQSTTETPVESTETTK